ncbi:MAG: hypothetical protein M3314_14485, partial [Actinomycetota bacterium]|nr:hypothetical protein [Actinomycetota bacterium]
MASHPRRRLAAMVAAGLEGLLLASQDMQQILVLAYAGPARGMVALTRNNRVDPGRRRTTMYHPCISE